MNRRNRQWTLPHKPSCNIKEEKLVGSVQLLQREVFQGVRVSHYLAPQSSCVPMEIFVSHTGRRTKFFPWGWNGVSYLDCYSNSSRLLSGNFVQSPLYFLLLKMKHSKVAIRGYIYHVCVSFKRVILK